MVPGKYFVTVKYNGKNINGSPFSVQIAGDNLNSSLREERTQRQQSKRSSVTMETMSRTSYVRHQYSESRRGTIQGEYQKSIQLIAIKIAIIKTRSGNCIQRYQI